MNGYDGFRLEMQTKLLEDGRSMEDIARIMDVFCQVAQSYDITKACTDIIASSGVPREVDEYLGCKLMEGLARGTVAGYRDRLYNFFRTVKLPYDQITSKDIRGYMLYYQHGREKPVTNRTMNAYQATIVRFFNWLQDVGYITNNPAKNIPAIKYQKKLKASMDRHDLLILMGACRNVREKAIVSCLYATGCRVNEACNIKISDINWHDKSIVVLGKGQKYRTVYFNDMAEIYIRQYLGSRKDDCQYLIVSTRGGHQVGERSIQKMMRKIYSSVADQMETKVTPHTVRHTMATLAIESGMAITTVQKILGHSSIETTMEYVDMSKVNISQEYRKYVV